MKGDYFTNLHHDLRKMPPLKALSLASGSKGNSIFIESHDRRLLIDQGISAKQLILRLQECGRRPEDIDAILVTHEHSDHIKGIRVLAKKYRIPVYANSETIMQMHIKSALDGVQNVYKFQTGESFCIGETGIQPFSVSHDAVAPTNFIIQSDNISLGIFSDLGHLSQLVKMKAARCDYLYLEANHDLEMLKNGPYPIELQRRIRSRFGHLSNEQSLQLMEELLENSRLQGISFIHLSEKNNHPHILKNAVQSRLEKLDKKLKFEICPQHQPGIEQTVN